MGFDRRQFGLAKALVGQQLQLGACRRIADDESRRDDGGMGLVVVVDDDAADTRWQMHALGDGGLPIDMTESTRHASRAAVG